jgi:hypothetical protein
MKTSRASLRERWIGQEWRIAAIVADLQEDRDWTRHLLGSADGSNGPLPQLATCQREKLDTEQAARDLRGITLANVDMMETMRLADADLDYAIFENVQMHKASLRGSSLVGVIFRGNTSLNGAILERAKLKRADCRDISLNGADLRYSNLHGCDFRGADLRNARLLHARVKEEGTFGFLSARRGWTKFGGGLQTFENILAENGLRLRKHIARSSQIEELKKERPVYAWLFWFFANYGRSAARFGLFAFIGCWLFFAFAYASLPVLEFLRGSPAADWLESLHHPAFCINGSPTPLTLYDGMYLSAVTITTLGYGDIVPAQGDGLARLLVAAEAITGVILLGAFINMLVMNAIVEGD